MNINEWGGEINAWDSGSAPVSIEALITEAVSSFTDSSQSATSAPGILALQTTETLSNFTDLSGISISTNSTLLITENLPSFLDSTSVIIAQEINANITEVTSRFVDASNARMPTNWAVKAPVTTIWTTKG